MRGEMRANRGAVAEHRAIDDGLTIDGMGQRLAYAHIIERGLLVVGRQESSSPSVEPTSTWKPWGQLRNCGRFRARGSR